MTITNTSLSIPALVLGSEVVFPNQNETGVDMFKYIKDAVASKVSTHLLLVAEPQQGKTGAISIACKHIFDYFKAMKKTVSILYVLNINDNSLLRQTQERFQNSGLYQIRCVLQTNLRKELERKSDYKVLIFDEAHYANGKDKINDTWLVTHGVFLNKSYREWTTKNIFVINVSATPFAHLTKDKVMESNNSDYVQNVTLQPGPGYYSIIDMHEKHHRIKQSEALFDGNKISDFFIEILSNFSREESNGYLVVRCNGEQNKNKIEKIKKYIQMTYGNSITSSVYSCEMNNIGALSESISKQPNRKEVVFIKHSLRAGKTLDETRYIRGWIESPNSNSDCVIQSVGRCCGYPSKMDGRPRSEDTFPVYCNVDEIEEICAFYKTGEIIPSGIFNKTNVMNRSKYIYDKKEFQIQNNNFSEVKAFCATMGYNVGDFEVKDGVFVRQFKTEKDTRKLSLNEILENDAWTNGLSLKHTSKRAYPCYDDKGNLWVVVCWVVGENSSTDIHIHNSEKNLKKNSAFI